MTELVQSWVRKATTFCSVSQQLRARAGRRHDAGCWGEGHRERRAAVRGGKAEAGAWELAGVAGLAEKDHRAYQGPGDWEAWGHVWLRSRPWLSARQQPRSEAAGLDSVPGS